MLHPVGPVVRLQPQRLEHDQEHAQANGEHRPEDMEQGREPELNPGQDDMIELHVHIADTLPGSRRLVSRADSGCSPQHHARLTPIAVARRDTPFIREQANALTGATHCGFAIR